MSRYSEYIKELKEKGFTVIPNILDEKECEYASDELWSWLKDFDNRISKDDPETWAPYFPYSMDKKGIIQQYKLGQSQFVWDIRQNPKVKEVFAEIWDDDDLLVSFDGINVQIPPEITKKYSHPLGYEWHHTDQSVQRSGFECVQGFIDIYGTNEDDGCFIAREKSHLFHEKYGKEFKLESKEDWVKLDNSHYEWFDKNGCKTLRVPSPKGSLVLWDSRTIHANATALPDRKEQKFRFVVYVCMTPRKWANEATLKKKQKYFNEGRITNHYPHKIKVFPKVPHLYDKLARYKPGLDKVEENFQPAILTSLGRRLAGFD